MIEFNEREKQLISLVCVERMIQSTKTILCDLENGNIPDRELININSQDWDELGYLIDKIWRYHQNEIFKEN